MQNIGPEDISQAVKCLKILGSGFKLITLKERTLVRKWEYDVHTGTHLYAKLVLFPRYLAAGSATALLNPNSFLCICQSA